MKPSYIFSTVAIATVGLAGVWGANEYLSLKSQLEEVQTAAQAEPSPPIVPAPSPAPSSPSPPAQIDFDKLPLCDQLDSLAKSGKSVSQFIAKSGRYDEFAAQVTANCNWNAEQLKLADRILHLPVKKTVAQEQSPRRQPAEANESLMLSSRVPTPRRTPWNNCNGRHEVGESYSAECAATQGGDSWQHDSYDYDEGRSDDRARSQPNDNRPELRQKGAASFDPGKY